MLKRLLDYNEGEEFDLVLMVKNSELRQDKRGKHYLLMQLADSSGSIRANYWQAKLRTPAASTPARWLRPQG